MGSISRSPALQLGIAGSLATVFVNGLTTDYSKRCRCIVKESHQKSHSGSTDPSVSKTQQLANYLVGDGGTA